MSRENLGSAQYVTQCIRRTIGVLPCLSGCKSHTLHYQSTVACRSSPATKTDRYASQLTAVIEVYDVAVWASSYLYYPQGPVLKLALKWEGLPGPERSATESKPQWAAPQAGGPTHKARQRHSELNITGDPSVFLLFPMFPAQR